MARDEFVGDPSMHPAPTSLAAAMRDMEDCLATTSSRMDPMKGATLRHLASKVVTAYKCHRKPNVEVPHAPLRIEIVVRDERINSAIHQSGCIRVSADSGARS